jgi:hypothetical protein
MEAVCSYGMLKMTAFRDIAPCRLTEVDRRFRGAYYLHNEGTLMVEAVHSSEMLVYFSETTWH